MIDSFLVTKNSMKFEEKIPSYEKAIEVYTPACKDDCMPRAFGNSVKISL
jgi:hypothetical protein